VLRMLGGPQGLKPLTYNDPMSELKLRPPKQLVEKVLLVIIPATRESCGLQKREENADSLPAAGRLVAVAPRNDNG